MDADLTAAKASSGGSNEEPGANSWRSHALIGRLPLSGIALLTVLMMVELGVPSFSNCSAQSAGSGSRIADAFTWLRIEHFNHHSDDMARGTELTVCPCSVELAEEVFVKIALYVLVLSRNLHGINGLTGFDEKAWLINLKFCVGHLHREGTALFPQRFNERESGFFHRLESFFSLKITPMRPTEFGIRKEGLKLCTP
jgi:hypothetical protein